MKKCYPKNKKSMRRPVNIMAGLKPSKNTKPMGLRGEVNKNLLAALLAIVIAFGGAVLGIVKVFQAHTLGEINRTQINASS